MVPKWTKHKEIPGGFKFKKFFGKTLGVVYPNPNKLKGGFSWHIWKKDYLYKYGVEKTLKLAKNKLEYNFDNKQYQINTKG